MALNMLCKALHNLFRDMTSILVTRPIFHKMDETIRGHVFCSFLALVLRKELDKRFGIKGKNYEWSDIKRDLTKLREVILSEDQSRVTIRTVRQGICADVFKSVGVALPLAIRSLN